MIQKYLPLTLLGLLFILCPPVQSQTTRKTVNFNHGWYFVRAPESKESREQASPSAPDTETGTTLQEQLSLVARESWTEVALPHTAFLEPLIIKDPWQGICFYRKDFSLDSKDHGQKFFLRFEGAMHTADVWLNDKHLTRHTGGYTPFIVDMTGLVRFERPNTITVKLDNRDAPYVLPGKPLRGLDDWYHSGIYRSVTLIKTHPVYITDAVHAGTEGGGGIFVSYSQVSSSQATLEVKTHIQNDGDSRRTCTLLQELWPPPPAITPVASFGSSPFSLAPGEDTTQLQYIVVERPRLWSPDQPSLYTLRTRIVSDGKAQDDQETRLGIRSLSFSREEGFKLNGVPTRLVGTNRHQEYPYLGNAISSNAQYRDLWKIRNSGHNFVRLGHYPQDPSVLDACDELGLLVVSPVPGWQFFNNDKKFIGSSSDNLVASGICNIFRLEKPAFYFYQSQRDPSLEHPLIENGPMVHLATNWTQRPKPTKVVVFSNCDEVELLINNKPIARQTADLGLDTRYSNHDRYDIRTSGGNSWDGGNCRNMAFPPFTFPDIKWEKGEITARGYQGKEVVARSTRRTPLAEKALDLSFSLNNRDLTADGADTIFVHARVVDENKTLLPDDNRIIRFKVKGPGKIIGPDAIKAEAGIATILLQAERIAGVIQIEASSAELPDAAAQIESISSK